MSQKIQAVELQEAEHQNASPAVEPKATCDTCQACCCRLEVMLITDTGVPDRYVEIDPRGGMVMARLDDGWCAALNRDTLLCSIYNNRPLICREFATGEDDCLAERNRAES